MERHGDPIASEIEWTGSWVSRQRAGLLCQEQYVPAMFATRKVFPNVFLVARAAARVSDAAPAPGRAPRRVVVAIAASVGAPHLRVDVELAGERALRFWHEREAGPVESLLDSTVSVQVAAVDSAAGHYTVRVICGGLDLAWNAVARWVPVAPVEQPTLPADFVPAHPPEWVAATAMF